MPAENAQMKQFFKKEWINVTMYAVITLLLFCSMFWEPLVYVVMLAIIAYCGFANVQQAFYLIFFTYPFQFIYTVFIQIKFYNIYFILLTMILFMVGIKYLIAIGKKKKKFNLTLFILSMAFLLYCFLPFGPYKMSEHIQMIGIIAGLYLCYEYREQISFKNLVLIASIGLLISCLFSFVAFETPRMLSLLTQYTNYGYIKFQGLFGNPNVLVLYNIIVLPCLLVLYLQEHKWYSIILFMANFAFAYMALSRNFIMCLAFMLPLYAILELVYYKKKGLLHVACVAVSMLALCAVMFTSTKIYLVRFNILPESSIAQVQEDTKAAVIIPSIPAEPNKPENSLDDEIFVDDPGREGLWQRYWGDYTSSWKTILFGRGVAYPQLGNIGAHQSYLNILWQFGLLGTLLILTILLYFLKGLIKKKSVFAYLILLPFLMACFVENMMFNMWTFLMFINLISFLHDSSLKTKNNSI